MDSSSCACRPWTARPAPAGRGQLVLRLPADVRQRTTRPVIEAAVAKGVRVHTDEYASYARLSARGWRHVTARHARGEHARDGDGDGVREIDGDGDGVREIDGDGDGVREIHIDTMEGTWSLPRSWLRPHRGVSQEKLPLHLGFFEVVHNARRRGKALLGALVAALVA